MSLSGRAVLVGRERERRQLLDVVDRAVDGQGALLLVSGEAGIGKTSLIEDLIRRVADRDLLVLSGGAYEVTATPPYGPWVEIVRAIPEADGIPPVPEQLRVGGGMAGIDSQAALFELSGRYLASVAGVKPVLILLEDLHWADPASLDLLRYLSREFTDVPVLLIATYRDDEITPGHHLYELLPAMLREGRVERIHLHRLERDAVSSLVREQYRLGHADEERLINYLDRLAEGNPFFINELLFTLAERQVLRPVPGGWALGDLSEAALPTVIQQVINGRLARIGPEARELLDIAAVVGYDAPLDLLRQLHEGPDAALDGALQQAIDYHLVSLRPRQSSTRFSHALVRQTIYEAIPPLRRQTLHRRVGDLLASRSRPDLSTVANHYYEAKDERALEWLVRAAEQAQALFAPQTVVDHASRGIDLAARMGADEPLVLYRLRGYARESVGDFDGAREDHETVLARAQDREDRRTEWQALLDLGALWAFRDYQQTREYCERAVELAREMDDPAALGHSLNRLGNWHTNAERPEVGLRHHEEALEIFQELGDEPGVASTLDLLGVTYYIAGDMARSLGFYERAIPLFRSLNDRPRLGSALVTVFGSVGQCFVSFAVRNQALPPALGTDIRVLLDEALEIARDTGSRAAESQVLSILGGLSNLRGNLRAGLVELMESLRIAESIEHHQWVALANERLGAVYLDLFAYDLASSHLRRALQIATAVRSSFFQQGTIALLGMACTRAGKLDEAARLLLENTDLDRSPDTLTMRTCWLARAELLLALDQRRAALDTIDELIDSVPPGGICLSPQLLRIRGEILIACELLDEADSQLQEAHDAALRIGNRLIRWQILARQSRLYLIRGQTGKADETRTAALEIVEELADQLDNEELQAEFLSNARAQIPGELPFTPDRLQTFNDLTPREFEVLACLTRGNSDRQIADELFISPRTVETHVSNILRKLDVGSRTAAVALAIREELV